MHPSGQDMALLEFATGLITTAVLMIMMRFVPLLFYRYLSAVRQQEVLPDFKALESQTVDEAAVKEHIRQEKAQEAQLRASAAATVQPGKSTAAQHAAGGGMQAKARH